MQGVLIRISDLLRITVLSFVIVLIMVGCGPEDRYLFSASKVLTYTPESLNLPYEQVRFLSRDGKELTGWIIDGDIAAPKLLYLHGNGANLSESLGYIQLFHQLGFSVFTFDYRGFGESSGEVNGEKDLYDDTRGALDYLEKLGWQTNRMIYYGQSLGAALAIQMALETPPAGMVIESAFTSFPDMARRMAPVTYTLFGWCCKIDSFDNINKIRELKIPILIVHGDRDNLTPVEMSQRLFIVANEPKTLYIIKGGGHCDAVKSGGIDYLDAWRSFLNSISESGGGIKNTNNR